MITICDGATKRWGSWSAEHGWTLYDHKSRVVDRTTEAQAARYYIATGLLVR